MDGISRCAWEIAEKHLAPGPIQNVSILLRSISITEIEEMAMEIYIVLVLHIKSLIKQGLGVQLFREGRV
jgi:hypothetical protein